MLRPIPSIHSRLLKGLKITSQKYLKNIDEPLDKPIRDKPFQTETVLVENSLPMRRRFRQIAHNIKVIKMRRYTTNAKNNQ